ncbi:MAG TPA: type 1 glutamine amidotransferase [Candidatus Nanoarchaeia archaeon]|nr:type 1 glutamine amidotransferase [Candidatus Nanoarchaeia archaeon]
MAVLIATNSPLEGPGYIGSALQHLNIKHDVVSSKARVDISRYSSFIMLGGPQSVNDDTEEIKKALKLVRDITDSGKPYLGICLGAQLLAKSLNTRVKPNKVKEIGSHIVTLTDEGRKNPLFSGLPPTIKVFQWHGETFEMPNGAKRLAEGSLCQNQAFQHGNCYGLQFHLEVSRDMVKEWLFNDGYKSELKEQGIDIFQFAERFAREEEEYESSCRILINNFVVQK